MKINFEDLDDDHRKNHQLLTDKINYNLKSLATDYLDVDMSKMWELYYSNREFKGDTTENCTNPILRDKILHIIKETISSNRS